MRVALSPADDASTCILIGGFWSKYLSTIAFPISSLTLLNAICSRSVQMNCVLSTEGLEVAWSALLAVAKVCLSNLLAPGSSLVVFRLLVATSGRSPLSSLGLVSLHPLL